MMKINKPLLLCLGTCSLISTLAHAIFVPCPSMENIQCSPDYQLRMVCRVGVEFSSIPDKLLNFQSYQMSFKGVSERSCDYNPGPSRSQIKQDILHLYPKQHPGTGVPYKNCKSVPTPKPGFNCQS